MRGHIQERGKSSWRVKVFVGRDATGVRRYVERTVHGTRREAERELARVVVEVDEGRHAAAAPMTFGELLDRWLDVKRRTVEAKTIESYEWVARRYVRPALRRRRTRTPLRHHTPTAGSCICWGAGRVRARSPRPRPRPCRRRRTPLHRSARLDPTRGLPRPEGRCLQALAKVAEQRSEHTTALEHLEEAGALFARYGVTYHLDQVLAAKEILKA